MTALKNHGEEADIRKLTAATLALSTLSTDSVWAHEADESLAHTGTATIQPTGGSDNVLGNPGGFNASSNIRLGLTLTYMATDNIGVELLVVAPLHHKVDAGPAGTIVTVHQLPPILMAQQYFSDTQNKVRPRMETGINYTIFSSEDSNDTGKAAGLSDPSLRDSWSATGQIGLDYLINHD